ncbi:ankyrin repeat domain protein, partial [Lasius niger]
MHTNNKLSNNHQLQLLEKKKKEFANFDQSEPSNARETNTKQDKQEEHKLFDNNSSNAAGLRSSLHEEQDAEKFDDIIFNNDIIDRFVKEEKPDDILNHGKQYKIIFEKNNNIVEILKDTDLTPDLKKLAKKLAVKVLFRKKGKKGKQDYLNLNNKPFAAYKVTLEKEMFDINNEETIKLYTFKKNFINDENLSNEAKLLRRALEREGLKLIKDKNDFWNKADNKKFITSGKNTKAYKGIELGIEEKQLPNVLVSDDEIERFFDKLVFAVKQPNEKELEKLIQNKICNSLDNLHNLKDHQQTYQAEIIYNDVLKKMLDWLNNSKSTPLSNKDNFFKQAKESLNDNMSNIPFLEYISILKYDYIAELNIKFKSEKMKEIKRFLNSKDSNFKIFNLISSEKDICLSQAKIYQITNSQRL